MFDETRLTLSTQIISLTRTVNRRSVCGVGLCVKFLIELHKYNSSLTALQCVCVSPENRTNVCYCPVVTILFIKPTSPISTLSPHPQSDVSIPHQTSHPTALSPSQNKQGCLRNKAQTISACLGEELPCIVHGRRR